MDALEQTTERRRATVTVDRDGIIHQWADGVTDVVGYSADETLGRNLDVVIPPVLRRLHWHGFDRAMRRGQLSRPDKTYKVPTVRNDGRIVVAHTTFELIPGEVGRVNGAVVTFVGVGSAWQGRVWRFALAPVDLARRIWQRVRSGQVG